MAPPTRPPSKRAERIDAPAAEMLAASLLQCIEIEAHIDAGIGEKTRPRAEEEARAAIVMRQAEQKRRSHRRAGDDAAREIGDPPIFAPQPGGEGRRRIRALDDGAQRAGMSPRR